ncbi:MAG: hypothetical protein R6V19_15590, partial [Armatimonadota bacterium]
MMITEQGLGELMPPAGSVRSVEETVKRVEPEAAVELQDDQTAADGAGVEVDGGASAEADGVLEGLELGRLRQFPGRSLDIADLEIVDDERLQFDSPESQSGQDTPGVLKQGRAEAKATTDEATELRNVAQGRSAGGHIDGDISGLRPAGRRDASAVELPRRESDIVARGAEMVGSPHDDSGVHGHPIAGPAEASSPPRFV